VLERQSIELYLRTFGEEAWEMKLTSYVFTGLLVVLMPYSLRVISLILLEARFWV
jgi:hypothetical protein